MVSLTKLLQYAASWSLKFKKVADDGIRFTPLWLDLVTIKLLTNAAVLCYPTTYCVNCTFSRSSNLLFLRRLLQCPKMPGSPKLYIIEAAGEKCLTFPWGVWPENELWSQRIFCINFPTWIYLHTREQTLLSGLNNAGSFSRLYLKFKGITYLLFNI